MRPVKFGLKYAFFTLNIPLKSIGKPAFVTCFIASTKNHKVQIV